MTGPLDQSLLRSLLEQARDVIYLLRLVPEVRFQYVNQAVEQAIGYGPRDFYDDPILHRRIIHPEDLRLLAELRADPGRLEHPVLVRWFHRDGRLVLTEERVTPIRDDAGALVGIQGVGRLLSYFPKQGEVFRAPATDLQRFRAKSPAETELIVICAACKAVREEGGWISVEEALERGRAGRVSHGMCPDCAYRLYRCSLPAKNGDPAKN